MSQPLPTANGHSPAEFPLQWPWKFGRVYEVHVAPRSIPFALIEPHRRQAMENHSQTLERLAERGGLSFQELLAVLAGRNVHEPEFLRMAHEDAIERVKRAVNSHREGPVAQPMPVGRPE